MAEETLSQRLERYFDAVLGYVTGLVERNPRKTAVVIVGLVALVILT